MVIDLRKLNEQVKSRRKAVCGKCLLSWHTHLAAILIGQPLPMSSRKSIPRTLDEVDHTIITITMIITTMINTWTTELQKKVL